MISTCKREGGLIQGLNMGSSIKCNSFIIRTRCHLFRKRIVRQVSKKKENIEMLWKETTIDVGDNKSFLQREQLINHIFIHFYFGEEV